MSALALRWLPVPVLVCGFLGAWGLARGRPAAYETPPAPPPPRAEVVEARPRAHRVVVRTHGSVEPRTEIELVAEVPGRVAAVSPALAAGGFFEADDVLVELDRADAELALERAEASLMRAESELRLSRARLERLRSLAASEVASAAQIEEAEHAFHVSRARLRETRAIRAQARRSLDRTRIRAPFAGRVREERVGVGQFVSRGTSVARVYAVDYAEARLPVPSAELAHLELPLAGADTAPVPAEAAPGVVLRARFAGREFAWRGRVVRTEGEIAARSRMLHVVARVDDPYGRSAAAPERPPLTAGLFVEARIEGRTLRDVFVLPRAALRGAGELLVVEPDGRVRARSVEVLRSSGEEVVVGAGLAAGERVIATALGVVPGSRVRAVRPAALAGRAP